MTNCRHATTILLIAIGTCCLCFGKDPQPLSLAQRWLEFGVQEKSAKTGQLQPFALCELVKTLPENSRTAFLSNALKSGNDFLNLSINPPSIEQAKSLSARVHDIITRGATEFPPIDSEDTPILDCLIVVGASSTLAADAFQTGDTQTALAHLAFNLRFADFIFESQITEFEYLMGVTIKRTILINILALAAKSSDPKLLGQAEEIYRRHHFKPAWLEASFRKETRITHGIAKDFKQWLRDQSKAGNLGTMLCLFSPPLKDCTLDQLLAMDYDADASLLYYLKIAEANLRWLKDGKPLSAHPDFPPQQKKPGRLHHYKTAPNGLFLIFEDCNTLSGETSTLIAHQTLDAFARTAFAWLRAETDGMKISGLGDLVPNYLDSIPIDPADGKTLRCIPKKRAIYSIGIDLKDHQGVSNPPPNQFSAAAIEPAFVIPD